MTSPLTEQQLDEDEIASRATAALHCPNAAANGRLDGQHTLTGSFTTVRCELCDYSRPRGERPEETAALLDEIRRLRDQLASARSEAIASAADVVDAKLTAEPDHNRASALYELLLQLRGELPCTCARTGGLHAKDCSKYVPGHELISRHNALAVYRAATTVRPAV
jgi:hypothetical protein